MRPEAPKLIATMDHIQIDLYEFLTESELQHYYNSIKNELKITNASQFKYATDEDLKQIGLSRPEIRRLRKFYEKYFPHGYLSKIKRLLQAPTAIVKRDDGSPTLSHSSAHSSDAQNAANASGSPSKTSNNKHIIPADSICVNKQLGTGEFGIVQQGVWTNGSERIQVAIKCLCRERMQSNPMEFLKEAAIMHSIEHENIVRLYGVVLATDSLMLVTELAHLRSLLECLKDSGLRVSFLTIPTLCEFAIQICNGMKYLENKRLIHRDLAARNILVFSKNKVKISDFGLSRALGVGKDYYKTNFNVNLKLPIAWCAPECINYLLFTNASDVWAYGVCLWEMFSYGFQPWAALTGLQILEAIDAPNYQRLEQPECCPRDYYQLMMKCWQDDPLKRPKFNEIHEMLPEIKPEQLKAVFNYCEPKKDHLLYRQGDIITVLDRNTSTTFWKGALTSGKTGLFNPANTVAYLESIPSSNRESFCRTSERCSKRKLRTEMISKPQNDLKHTGHIGIDGDSFGDVAFLANSQNYNHLPRQIVTPYKPSEDIEQTPLLLPPTPTSPDSLQTASSYFPEELPTSSTNPTFISSNENTPKQIGSFGQTSFNFSEQHHQNKTLKSLSSATNPFTNMHSKSQAKNNSLAMQNNNYDLESNAFNNVNLVHDLDGTETEAAASISKRSTTTTSWASSSGSNPEEQHEYHEISDDDIAGDKFDFGPSLLAEINSMFGSMSANASSSNQPKSPDLEHINKKNELTEYSNKLNRKSSSGESNGNKTGTSKKKGTACTVKPISVKDEKILNHAIEIANEISARSMTDLVCEHAPSTQSPKRKFSFRFPHLSHHGSHDKSNASGYSGGGSPVTSNVNSGANGISSYSKEKKNFTEELKSIPDLQRFRSMSEIENFNKSDIRIPLFDKETSDFCFQKSHEILSRPFLNMPAVTASYEGQNIQSEDERDVLSENIIDIENTLKAINLDFMQNYNELDKTDSAETLLNEKFSSIVTSLEDEISSATGSLKSGVYEYGNGVHTKFDFSAATSHLDKHLQYVNAQSGNSAALDAAHENKFVDDKRSSTPDTGFASRDTNLSLSRRSSQKSSYSPQENYFSPKDSLIGEEGREAYNSLIERKSTMIGGGVMSPASSLLSRLDTNEFELANAKTFPRRSVHLRCEDEVKLPAKGENPVCVSQEMSIPQQNAPRPMTLPTRGSVGRFHKSEIMLNAYKRSSPDAFWAAGNDICNLPENGTNDKESPCESPSYLTNTFYTFPDKSVTSHSELEADHRTDSNPIPLPSREGKKHIKSNPKRHVRKYPLIIPAYGVQRTLNKVTEITPNDDDASQQAESTSDRSLNQMPQADPKTQSSVNLRRFTHEVVAAVRPTTRNSATYENTTSLADGKPPERTYINLQNVPKSSSNEATSTTDSASLQFESILEDDVNKVDVLQSPDVTDGFYNFSIQKEQYNKGKEIDFDKSKISGLCESEDVLKNLDIDKNLNIVATTAPDNPDKTLAAKTVTMSSKAIQSEASLVKISTPTATSTKDGSVKTKQSNELAGHALFKKVRESVDLAMNHSGVASTTDHSIELVSKDETSANVPESASETQLNSMAFTSAASRLKDSNSVSCEDLLEFSDKKPKGCERGVDSDEVRIMMKVLDTDATPTRCLHVLEFINWDVHKAIKLIKLQNILATSDLSLTESVKALQKFEWDLQITALKMKGLK